MPEASPCVATVTLGATRLSASAEIVTRPRGSVAATASFPGPTRNETPLTRSSASSSALTVMARPGMPAPWVSSSVTSAT